MFTLGLRPIPSADLRAVTGGAPTAGGVPAAGGVVGPTPALAESGELSDSLVTPTATAPMLAAHMFFAHSTDGGQ